ncbi:MAG: hypothetical protein OXC62_04430 [Aestuariivita sp.]|nr:hypothetical protein [Aestuariivita sp.]
MTIFARFADESGKISQNRAKPKLFEPNRKNELSIFNVSKLSSKEKCESGLKNVAKPKGKKLYGWAELSHSDFYKFDLEIIQDNTPPGHANAIGWPKPELVKQRKDKAQSLAKIANCTRLNPTARTCVDCQSQDYK